MPDGPRENRPLGDCPNDASPLGEPSSFKAFEAAGWSDRAATYGVLMARATVYATHALLQGVEPGTRLLDVGAGLGDLCAAATARGAVTTGIDLAPNMVRTARERHPGLTFLEGDAERLPFEDGAFDVVTGAFVINHLPDPERFAGREQLLALLPGEVTEVTFDLELDSFDALWDGLLGGTVRTAARLTAAHRDPLRALAEPYRREDGYALPTTVRVVTACSGRSGP